MIYSFFTDPIKLGLDVLSKKKQFQSKTLVFYYIALSTRYFKNILEFGLLQISIFKMAYNLWL